MGRLLTVGAESNDVATAGLESLASGGTIVTSVKRTGNYAFDCSVSGATFAFSGGSLGVGYYARAYVRLTANPGGNAGLVVFRDAALAQLVGITMNSSGFLFLNDIAGGTGQVGSLSPSVLPLSVWNMLELYCLIDSGGTDVCEARLNGVSFAAGSGMTISDNAPTNFSISAGFGNGHYDDIAVNNSSGNNQNTWPGSGRVVLLLPISDNARDTLWTGGVGGTTNLFDAVNNTPPLGIATETNLSQIEHAGNAAGTTDRYDANMTAYSSLGITPKHRITCMLILAADGEDIATGSKLLNYELLSNPVIASSGNVIAGNNPGALGTYITNWAIHGGTMIYNPSVALAASPVMRVRRPETATRVASVCFMGVYLEFTDVAPLVLANQAVNRAAIW